MANVTLLVSKTCSACPSAKTMWKGMKVKYSFTYREIDISSDAGQELAERHSIRAVPATIINGRLTFIGVPPRESAEKAIQAKAKPKPKKTDEED
jgi:glutaredoxin